MKRPPMTRIISSLSDVSADYDVLFCDLWGCLHNGHTPYPAAVAALEAFRAKGGRVVLMTNAPRPWSFVRASLDRMGVPQGAYDLVVSSGDATQEAMLRGQAGRRVFHLGPAKDDGFFTAIPDEFKDAPAIERVPLDEAESIICTGPFHEETETPQDYDAMFLMAKTRGLPMFCANPDIVVDFGDRRIYCAGALAVHYQQMGGVAHYYGKPYPPIYDRARRLLDLGADARILAVGDGILTDIAGAASEGIDALFITGGLAHDQFGPDVEHPDPALLAAWLDQQQQAPEYAIGRLR